MLTARVYRLYPSRAQIQQLAQHFGCARFVYNEALSYSQKLYHDTKQKIGQYELITRLPSLKINHPYLSEVCAQVLQQSVMDFCIARNNFIRTKKGYPKFKNKKSNQSIRFPQDCCIDEAYGVVIVPKLGKIKSIIHTPVSGGIKSITISKNRSGQYHASVLVEDGLLRPKESTFGKSIGLDLGLKDLLVTSDGMKVPNPKHFKKSLKKLKRKQQTLSRCKYGSNRRNKAKLRVARIHQLISNQRKDFHHKISRQIVNDNQVIVVEDLAIRNMIKNRHLSNAISDASWGQIVNFMRYKASREGKLVLKCSRWLPSSRMCSHCGTLNKDLKLSERTWSCGVCGSVHDRDENAAINIVRGGLLESYPISYLLDREILKRV